MFKHSFWLALVGIACLQAPASAQTGFANMVDHLHLAAPDPVKAVEWYVKHFDGKPTPEGTDRLMFGETRMIIQRNEKPEPSSGSVLDHIGFSVKDLDATMKAFEADGVKIIQPARDVAGLFKLAFVEDPWGMRIEVVQDPEKLGLHHVHLRGPDVSAVLAFYKDKFAGERTKLKGRLDGLKLTDVWLLVQPGAAVPSEGHAIDHIGFRTTDLAAKTSELKAQSVKFTTEPRPLKLASGVMVNFAYLEGPDGAKVELVQR